MSELRQWVATYDVSGKTFAQFLLEFEMRADGTTEDDRIEALTLADQMGYLVPDDLLDAPIAPEDR